MHIRQSEMAALELEGKLGVIDAQAMKHRSVQVVNMHWVANDVVGVVVAFAVAHSWLESPPSNPHCEASRVVVASIVVLGQPALTIDCTSELATPNYEGIIQHSPLL